MRIRQEGVVISDIAAQPIKKSGSGQAVVQLLDDLHVELLGEEIVVTRPKTDFLLAYRKRIDRPSLIVTRSWVDPHTTPPR